MMVIIWGRAHLGLTTADGGHFRFRQRFGAVALFQGMKDHLQVGIGQNAGYCGNGRTAVFKAARVRLLDRGWNGGVPFFEYPTRKNARGIK